MNLQTNGLLAGSPVVFVTKIHDQFFPPEGQFAVLFTGLPAPLTSNVITANSAHDGARFQSVWRDFDCSPNSLALAGTLLDLYRVSWAPIGGNVSTDNYSDVSIHCAHAPLRTYASPVGNLRMAESARPTAMSATSPVSTSGVLVI